MIISFYKDILPDHEGRYLSDILRETNSWLENTHDYIQYLFPNREPSFYNPDAPLLSDQIIEEFKSNTELLDNVKLSLNRMILFYQMDDTKPWWVTKGNHNFLRITRILNTLRELGMIKEMGSFFNKLLIIVTNNRNIIKDKTLDYWQNAFDGPLESVE